MSDAGLVLVTGAGGFIGGAVCATLQAAGHSVRGLARPCATLPAGVTRASCADVLDRTAVRAAVAGAGAVVHLAGRAHMMRELAGDPAREFHRVNVGGTEVVAEEAARAGVECFVLLSSVAAVAVASDELLDEHTPPRPVSPYGASKLAAERRLAEIAGDGMRAPVLRPPLVYGPGMKGNPLRLFRLVDRGVPLPLGGIRNRRSVAYVGTVAGAVAALVAASEARAGAFYVADGQDVTSEELARAVGAALGKPARVVRLPRLLMRAAAAVGDAFAALAPVPLTSDALDRFTGSLAVDTGRLARVTGFRPSTTLADGLRATASWYRSTRPA